MLTQGRLVPRQPWAIKRTTPTALRGCNIRNDGFTHGNAGIISTVFRFFNSISFKRESGAKRAFFMRIDEPHRGSAFDSPGLASIASYPGLMCCMGHNAIGVALF